MGGQAKIELPRAAAHLCLRIMMNSGCTAGSVRSGEDDFSTFRIYEKSCVFLGEQHLFTTLRIVGALPLQ